MKHIDAKSPEKSSGVLLGYDLEHLQQGIRKELTLPLDSASYLTFGPSNSGKTVLNKLICGRLAGIADAKLTICDGKAYDYRFLRGLENARHYEYLDVAIGLSDFFAEFESRLKGENSDNSYRLIVLEEWSSFLRVQEKLDKKVAEKSLTELFSVTSQGRAYNCHALVSLQRPDSAFLSGFRENLTCVCGLGKISPEAAKMVGFNEYPEFSGISGKQGQGWLLTEQGELNQIVVPRVKNFERLHDDIITVATR
jgi:hypothetical protein